MNQQLTTSRNSDSATPAGQQSSPHPTLAHRFATGQRNIDWYVRKSGVYRSWRMMHGRCSPHACASNRRRFHDKGIRIHERYNDFWNFFSDMGERKADESLARHDDTKDFEPGNCYWLAARVRAADRVRPEKKEYKWQGKSYSEHQLARVLAVDRHYITKMRKAGGIKDEVTEDAVACLDALQTCRMTFMGECATLFQWATSLTCHLSLLRARLYKGILPVDIIRGLRRHG